MRYFLKSAIFTIALSLGLNAFAQTTQKWREMHKVKKKETVYGIAKTYGITEEELRNANPEMKNEGYQLKKGDYIFIPYSKRETNEPSSTLPTQKVDVRQREIRVGIMLPLHNENGDGRRMVEYYRGILLAIEDLKSEGISVDLHAWNVPETADIGMTLLEKGASDCDIIFGPLYTKQMDRLSQFAKAYGIKLVVPFSINGDHVTDNANIFQVYQRPADLDNMAINCFVDRFRTNNIIIVDCNDEKSTKAMFMNSLRSKMEESKVRYNVTNLTSSEESFSKAFSATKPNVVILNTGRSPQLNEVFRRLNALTAANPKLEVSMFGYIDWLLYEKAYLELFYKYDTYIPTYYYYNSASTRTKQLEMRYAAAFGETMMTYGNPRFAITGYDQARFFLRGLHRDGKTFTGESSDRDALQTQFRFVRDSENGGMRNRQFLFMHYNRNKSISTIVY